MKFFHKGMVLDVPSDIYYPREDSLLLAKVLEKMNLKAKKCLDIGCGSGLLSIILARQGADVTCTDINPIAVEVTEKNAKENSVELTALASDLFENVEGKFNIIVFNPPYLPEEKNEQKDITYSGGRRGRDVIERFIKDAEGYLENNGKVLLLISTLTGENEITKIFNKNGFSATVIACKKVPWEELIVIEAGKDSK